MRALSGTLLIFFFLKHTYSILMVPLEAAGCVVGIHLASWYVETAQRKRWKVDEGFSNLLDASNRWQHLHCCIWGWLHYLLLSMTFDLVLMKRFNLSVDCYQTNTGRLFLKWCSRLAIFLITKIHRAKCKHVIFHFIISKAIVSNMNYWEFKHELV